MQGNLNLSAKVAHLVYNGLLATTPGAQNEAVHTHATKDAELQDQKPVP